MQPHANLGINFRKHFKPIGVSTKRLEKEVFAKAEKIKKEVKDGVIEWKYVKDVWKELMKLGEKLRKCS
jgi:hypothetical protein